MSYVLNLLRKKSLKNGLWLYLLQTFNTVVPLLTLPYVTRVLGNSTYGVFVVALNIVSYLQVAVEYGFGMSATRKVALMNDDIWELSKEHTRVLFSRFFVLLCCLTVTIAYVLIFTLDRIQIICTMALCISLLGYCIQQNWLFQGQQEMKYISIVNIIGRIVSIVLIFLCVKKENDVVLYCILYSLSPFISAVIGLILAKWKYKVRIVTVSFREVFDELKDGFYVFTTQLSSKLFGAIGITFLGIFAEKNVVGTFGAIQKIPNIIAYAWAPISQVLYPISSIRMTKSFYNGVNFVKGMRKKILPLFIILAILLSIFSRAVVGSAFGDEYEEYHYWIIPLLAGMILSINNNFIGIQILLGSRHDKEYVRAFQIGVAFTVLLNFAFTYFLKGDGAAIAPLLSELILYIALKYQCNKIKEH